MWLGRVPWLLLLGVALIVAGSAGDWSEEDVKLMYEGWLVKYGKSYNVVGENDRRFEIFTNNLRYIDKHNRLENDHSYGLALTRFANLTDYEFRASYLGARPRQLRPPSLSRYPVADDKELPEKVERREKGTVAPVKDQGSCDGCCYGIEGSCWVASTVGAPDMITLSKQEPVDCDTAFNQDCNGELVDSASEFIIDNGGIDTEDYCPCDGQCDPDQKNAKVVSIDLCEDLPVNDEKALKKAIPNQLLSVAVEAGGRNFQLYTSPISSPQSAMPQPSTASWKLALMMITPAANATLVLPGGMAVLQGVPSASSLVGHLFGLLVLGKTPTLDSEADSESDGFRLLRFVATIAIATYLTLRQVLWGAVAAPADRLKNLNAIALAAIAVAVTGVIILAIAGDMGPTSTPNAAGNRLLLVYVLVVTMTFYVGLLLLLLLSFTRVLQAIVISSAATVKLITFTTVMLVASSLVFTYYIAVASHLELFVLMYVLG